MEARTARAFGGVSAVAGLLSFLVWVPPAWYGSTTGDSYVFDPPPFSPLWVERTVVPVLTVLAVGALVVGMVGLVLRDREVAGRLRRWSGYVAVVGLAVLAVTEVTLQVVGMASTGGVSDLVAIGGVFLALGLGVLGLALALPSLLALGVGYLRADRLAVGAALVAAPVLTVALFGLSFLVSLGEVGTVLLTAPIGLAFVVVGAELWTHPDPVGEPDGKARDATTPTGTDVDEADRHATAAGSEEGPGSETVPENEEVSGREQGPESETDHPTGATDERGPGKDQQSDVGDGSDDPEESGGDPETDPGEGAGSGDNAPGAGEE